ncbi:hypothetical protein CDAR_454901 [Caerostris darwini]|uniref:Uncharacterized protein n=1 Tax=Caerostris darwini TaxID=1538125 RepID=A0AAV4WS30_9ARAC|nr:hypothetical protein CDAR_454901 [Caerostris darwini]
MLPQKDPSDYQKHQPSEKSPPNYMLHQKDPSNYLKDQPPEKSPNLYVPETINNIHQTLCYTNYQQNASYYMLHMAPIRSTRLYATSERSTGLYVTPEKSPILYASRSHQQNLPDFTPAYQNNLSDYMLHMIPVRSTRLYASTSL